MIRNMPVSKQSFMPKYIKNANQRWRQKAWSKKIQTCFHTISSIMYEIETILQQLISAISNGTFISNTSIHFSTKGDVLKSKSQR